MQVYISIQAPTDLDSPMISTTLVSGWFTETESKFRMNFGIIIDSIKLNFFLTDIIPHVLK